MDKILITTSNASVITPEILGPNCGVAPVVKPGYELFVRRGSCGVLGDVLATDADDILYPNSTVFQKWKIVGGTGAEIFAIDPANGKLSIANASAIDFSKTSYTLMVTVSDGYFTSNVQSIAITIPKKINVCHNGKNVLSISKNAAASHLAHGDCIGSCAGDEPSADRIGLPTVGPSALSGNSIQVYPNPAKGVININLGTNTQNIRKIDVLDLSGRVVMQLNVGKMQSLTIPSGRLKPGTYLIRMQGNNVSTQKLVVQ